MQRVLIGLAILTLLSCKHGSTNSGTEIITVSIAPFKYFTREIAGDDFKVNVMVPSGANPHIYEPYPEQVNQLRKSVAYISNGFLGFEMAWLDRFYQINKDMLKLSLGDEIESIASPHEHEHEGFHSETADPHYWVSPKCAMIIASSIKELLCNLNPDETEKYEANFYVLVMKIGEADSMAQSFFSEFRGRSFMIFHPNLAYLARDYGLMEMSVEYEGKEPPPSRMKELIDFARREKLNTIFIQKEYDIRNAKTIADEIGADIVVIDPLSEEWFESTMDIITALHISLINSQK